MELNVAASADDFIAIDFARKDRTNRWLILFHQTHLHRSCMRTKQMRISDEKRILHIACRMIGRKIQCLKIVVICLDFRTICHTKAHPTENVSNFLNRLGDNVHMSARLCASGQRQIERRLPRSVVLLHLICSFIEKALRRLT